MGLYVKKPITIRAFQFFPEKKPWPRGVELYESEKTESPDGTTNVWHGWRINTLEGPHIVLPGDWIITGIKGERYPCKPDIFAATYTLIEHSDVEDNDNG